ncbi:MAG: four helix bundle protein [Flavobacteriaceae bacterium]
MPTYKSFEELDCWKKCRKARIWIVIFVKENIDNNDRDLTFNLIRAARSTTRNIAEGFGRFHFKDNMRFCRISRGSLFELKDDLIICVDEKTVNRAEIEEGLKLINEAILSIHGYIKYLKARNDD